MGRPLKQDMYAFVLLDTVLKFAWKQLLSKEAIHLVTASLWVVVAGIADEPPLDTIAYKMLSVKE